MTLLSSKTRASPVKAGRTYELTSDEADLVRDLREAKFDRDEQVAAEYIEMERDEQSARDADYERYRAAMADPRLIYLSRALRCRPSDCESLDLDFIFTPLSGLQPADNKRARAIAVLGNSILRTLVIHHAVNGHSDAAAIDRVVADHLSAAPMVSAFDASGAPQLPGFSKLSPAEKRRFIEVLAGAVCESMDYDDVRRVSDFFNFTSF